MPVHKEESAVSSCVDRITVGRVQHSVHEVYCCLGNSYFLRAYCIEALKICMLDLIFVNECMH